MKTIFLFFFQLALVQVIIAQSVAINNTGANADASSALDVSSTTKGILYPRMSSLQRVVIVAPANGLRVFDLDTNTFWTYAGFQWVEDANYWGRNGTNIYKLNSGNVGIGTTTPNGNLQFSNVTNRRKIVLNETANNLHQFVGFGYSPNELSYQVAATTDAHIFYAAAGAAVSNPLMRIQGNGNVGIGEVAPNHRLHVTGTSTTTTNHQIMLNETTTGSARIGFSNSNGLGWNINGSYSSTTGSTSRLNFYSHNLFNNVLTLAGNGAIAINNNFGTDGQVLTSNGAGAAAAWETPAINNVIGVLPTAAGVNVTNTTGSYLQTGAYIDLPPGRYAVNVTMLLTGYNAATAPISPDNSSFWVRSSFTESTLATNPPLSPDIIGSYLISGSLQSTSAYGLLTGTIIINNASAITKRYRYIAGNVVALGHGPGFTLYYVGGNYWAENNIIAYRIR